MQIFQLLVGLCLLVIIHELGHFLSAKFFGVKVEKFYLFFNPGFSLFKWRSPKSGTVYGIGWLPLGGYVKLSGMIDESMDTQQMKQDPQPWEFRSKPAWQRFIIMIAGVVMNFILAVSIYAMMLFTYGEEYVPLQSVSLGMQFSEVAKEHGFADGDILLSADNEKLLRLDEENFRRIIDASQVQVLRDGVQTTLPITSSLMADLLQSKQGFLSFRTPFVVKEVMEDSPAALAGLMAGDSLVSIGGETLSDVSDYTKALAEYKQVPVDLGLYREGKRITLSVLPDSLGKVGVYIKHYTEVYPMHHVAYGFFASFPAGISKGYKKLSSYAGDFKWVFRKEGAQSIGGFGTMVSLFPDTFYWPVFWEITAYLSVMLAFMNLLPIPGLDGGHLIFLIYEMIRRKAPSQAFMEKATKFGLLFLLFLMFYANGMDVVRALFD